jgi:hypothetical protein
MNMNPCLAWKNIRILAGGKTAHHKTNLNMSMRMANGELTLNAKENMSVFGAHFNKVLNNHRPVDYSALDLLEQKPCLTLINNPITFSEVERAINSLKKGKSPGLNGIPSKALKAIDNTSQRTVHRHVCDFFEGKVDHEGWHKSQCIPVPKQGDLSNPNKWQGIMLMDMCSKVMMAQAFTLLDKHGTRFQFGRTPEIGCRDGLFTLKALLNARHNHDLTSYVGFVDLVKAYDTANHKLLIDILCRAASQYRLALLRLFFGWLLFVPSSIGSRLRPPNNLFVFIFHHLNRHPNQCKNVPPTCSNPHAPPLQHPSHHGRQLLFDCCVFQLNGGHLRPIHLYLSIFLMCFHSAPQTGEPAIAPPNPTTGDLRWIIGSRSAIGWWRQ